MMSRTGRRYHLQLWLPVLVLLAVQIGPLIILLLISLKSEASLLREGPLSLSGFDLSNYLRVLRDDGFAYPVATSAVIAFWATLGSVAAGGSLAYALARWTFRGHQVLKGSLLVGRMLPPVALAVPVFFLLKFLHLGDSLTGMVVAHTTFNMPFAAWLLLPFFTGLPKELEEAAAMDGCTALMAFWRIVLPVALPGLMVTAVFCFLASWNDFLFSLVIAGSGIKTAALAINGYMTGYGPEWGPMTAASIVILLPALALSLALQKHIVEGLTAGGVKDG